MPIVACQGNTLISPRPKSNERHGRTILPLYIDDQGLYDELVCWHYTCDIKTAGIRRKSIATTNNAEGQDSGVTTWIRKAAAMVYFPTILILPTNVYSLSFQKVESKRALDRFLFDYMVQGVSFADPHDKWTTLLGVSKEFWEDYIFYKLGVPIEWLLVRCLHHHLKSNSLHLLSGEDGLVLNSSNFRTFLGNEASQTEIEEALKILLKTWSSVHPKGVLEFKDLYVSTNFTIELLRPSLQELKFQGYIKDLGKNVYLVERQTVQKI